MVLSAGELVLARADLNATLPETCSIVRVTTASDGAGGQAETTIVVATVACRIGPMSGRDAQVTASLGATVDHVVTLPALTDVTPHDRIAIGVRSFEVTYVATRSEELSRRCYVTETV